MIYRPIFRTVLLIFLLSNLAGVASDSESIREMLDAAIALKREGKTIAKGMALECDLEFSEYADWIMAKHDVRSNAKLPEPERTEFYLNAIRAGLVYPSGQGGWMQKSEIRKVVYYKLLNDIEEYSLDEKGASIDPYRVFGAIIPAFQYGRIDSAVKAFELLQTVDGFLAREILLFSYDYLKPVNWIEQYYRSHDEHDKADMVKKLAIAAAFPEGLIDVKLSDFSGPPQAGVEVYRMGDNHTGLFKGGEVIVAVDGVKVNTKTQYSYVHSLDARSSDINLIFWQARGYHQKQARAKPPRILGLYLRDYEPR